MYHHKNRQYLLENIIIINHFMGTKNGITITYLLDGVSYFLLANPEQLSDLLLECGLIKDTRKSNNALYIKDNDGIWNSFEWYLPSSYSDADLLLLCTQHEEKKILASLPNEMFYAKCMRICYN
jgi:hypothetical protein